MRVIKFIKNGIYALASFLLITLMSVYIRKLFTENLPIQLLGLEGLFSNIVSILSLAELGISSVINYSLYKALANDDKTEINILMNICRFLYKVIGCFILVVSVILYFYLPFIIKECTLPWRYVELVYFIQIATILSTYFIAYKRILLIADQKDYICIKIDTICVIISNFIRIIAIVSYESYIFYAISILFFNILSNIIISFKIKRNYEFIKPIRINIDDIQKRKIFNDIGNFMVHKIAYVLYGGADSIIVALFLGLETAGIVANYTLIHAGIYKIMYKCFQGVVPSVGNLFYSENKEKSFKIYKTLDFVYTLFGAYICCVYLLFFQKFVALFFGDKFLLPDNYVWLLAINVFLSMQFENACNYRNIYGSFEKDKVYMILSAISKIIITVLLVDELGVSGLVIGTIAGLLFIIYGRIMIVFKYVFQTNVCMYIYKHFFIQY